MFLIVRKTDNVIIGSAIKSINLNDASAKGYEIYEIDDAEFNPEMLGSTLDYFEMVLE